MSNWGGIVSVRDYNSADAFGAAVCVDDEAWILLASVRVRAKYYRWTRYLLLPSRFV